MPQVYAFDGTRLHEFLGKVVEKTELVAPLKTDVTRFEVVRRREQLEQLSLARQSYYPVKAFFFRPRETLFQFTGKRIVVPASQPRERVFFGLRRCDLNGIHRQDMVFLQGNVDPYYAAQRAKSVLIGYHCNTAPSKWCFCGSMELKDFFDVMFFDRGKTWLAETGSQAGETFIRRFKGYFRPSKQKITAQDKAIPGTNLLERKDLSEHYDSPAWEENVKDCVSCTACTALCPTCYCHGINDETDFSGKKGERVREWSSCQLQDFSRVAGNHFLRETRSSRFKHRIFHQLQYFREKNGIDLCVGCGRCISGCPTEINFIKTINGLKG